jgi:hypothetical protein
MLKDLYMLDLTTQQQEIAQPGIKIVAIVNGTAAVLHFMFWLMVLLHVPQPWTVDSAAEKVDLIVTYGLGLADLVWSVPFLIVGSIWLYRRKPIGWLAAQMSNALYWYSFTFILVRELSMQNIRPGTILFLPFALFSFWAFWYLWQVRATFWNIQEGS